MTAQYLIKEAVRESDERRRKAGILQIFAEEGREFNLEGDISDLDVVRIYLGETYTGEMLYGGWVRVVYNGEAKQAFAANKLRDFCEKKRLNYKEDIGNNNEGSEYESHAINNIMNAGRELLAIAERFGAQTK